MAATSTLDLIYLQSNNDESDVTFDVDNYVSSDDDHSKDDDVNNQ